MLMLFHQMIFSQHLFLRCFFLRFFFLRCSSFNRSSLEVSTVGASDDRIRSSAEDPVGQVGQDGQVGQVGGEEKEFDEDKKVFSKMRSPDQTFEDVVADIENKNIDGSNVTKHTIMIDGNDLSAREEVLVKLDKDAKDPERDAETDDRKDSEMQYNAKENTAKHCETRHTERIEDNENETRGFGKVGQVAEKVADGMVIEVSTIQSNCFTK